VKGPTHGEDDTQRDGGPEKVLDTVAAEQYVDSSEEEEENGPDQYEYDGFVVADNQVDEEEEEEEQGRQEGEDDGEEKEKSKKRKRRAAVPALDVEDLMVISENKGTQYARDRESKSGFR
jgi:hypothetical protein